VSMFSGYVFWFIMSKLSTTEVIGTASALVSLVAIFSTVATLGVPSGVQRFLGRSFSEQKIHESNALVRSSLVLVTIGILGCIVAIIIAKDFFHNTFTIDDSMMLIAIALIISTSTYNLFRSIIIASLKTKMLPIITVVATSARIGVGITLVLIGTGALGITIGFTLFPIFASVLLFITMLSILRRENYKSEHKLGNPLKDTLSSSLANWIPALITTIGSQLGTIVVFGSKGAGHAGVYFIAFSIFTAISAATSVLLLVAYPALSAMNDGRKRFTWRIIKMSLMVTIPISSSIIFYSKDIMQLFGQAYVEGSFSLQLLLLSALPTVITSGVNSLIYSRGNYRQVLSIGLASSIPRTLLYFVLVPLYGSSGAAISYTLGSIVGFAASILLARMIGLQIFWKDLLLILILPSGLGLGLSYVGINYLAGIPITFVASYALFLKMRIVTRNDVQESMSILPSKIANPILRILNVVAKKLNKLY